MRDPFEAGGYELLWGDFHKHMRPEAIDRKLADARQHLDVYPVLCYPFEWRRKGRNRGLREETVGNRPAFLERWERLQAAAAEHNDPGEFVTFPAYEWNGNRTRWGDHNVIYFESGEPLDDAAGLDALYDHLRERRAFALPHHTGYRVGDRGKDWSTLDETLSPVVEVYSGHGSSEGENTPVGMANNPSMGPRVDGGTYLDALDRGHRVGVIASNDAAGLPGTWGKGIAGVWAEACTREAVWEALAERRTYGVTGDRIDLRYALDGSPMGSVVESTGDLTARVEARCPRPLDRVELVGDGRVVETYAHGGTWAPSDGTGVHSVLVEFGWGPKEDYGDWSDRRLRWTGTVAVEAGRLRDVQPRFEGWGQRYAVDGDACRFDLTTERDSHAYATTQGLICTFDADADADLRVSVDGREDLLVPVADAVERSHLRAFTDASMARIESEFGLSRAEIDNRDAIYHNAGKLKLHRAYPGRACEATIGFGPLSAAREYYYVRVSQVDGQFAWSSPVWIE